MLNEVLYLEQRHTRKWQTTWREKSCAYAIAKDPSVLWYDVREGRRDERTENESPFMTAFIDDSIDRFGRQLRRLCDDAPSR